MKMFKIAVTVCALLAVATTAFAESKIADLEAKLTAPVEQAVTQPEMLECGELPLELSLPQMSFVSGGGIPFPSETCDVATCADYPVPQGGNCNCSGELIRERCTRKCDGTAGQILETTCTVCGVCPPPPANCDFTQCIDHVSRACVPL